MLKIYKASAGSGKTFTLAYEYIRLLLAVKIVRDDGTEYHRLNLPKYSPDKSYVNNPHRHILAITFTNKATEEMKRRIIKELEDLVRIPAPGAKTDANYAALLCAELRCSRQELSEAADHALKQLLYDYHYFNVTTIDSFFQRVLRTFARELDRQGDFNIELEDKAAMNKAVDTMLDEFNRDFTQKTSLGQWIYDYMVTNIERGAKANFFNRRSKMYKDLVSLLSRISSEKFKPHVEPMREYLDGNSPAGATSADKIAKLSKIIAADIDSHPDDIKRHAQATVDTLAADGVTLADMKGVAKTCIERMLKGEMPKVSKGKWYENDTLRELLEGGAPAGCFKVKTKNLQPSHYDLTRDLFRHAFALEIRAADFAIVQKALTQLSLLGYAWRYLDTFITENNTVLLSDTNHLLSRIIGADETPFIYERLGLEIHHFLIDEFQDTSRMQWQNLKPLVANGLGENHDSLIIGDEKQSIYRFRNSDSSLLHTEVENIDFPASDYRRQIKGKAANENTNWRSAANVVRFNNTLFGNLAAIYQVEGYENVVQSVSSKRKDLEGYVHFFPIGAKPEAEADESAEPESEATGADSNPQLKTLAENIIRQRESGYAWSDIAILVNTHQIGGTVIDYLLRYYPSIPIMSDESLYLRKSTAVQMIVSMLQLFAMESTPKKSDPTSGNLYASAADVAVIVSRYHYFLSQGHDVMAALDKAVNAYEAETLQAKVEAIRQHRPSSLPALVEAIIYELLNEHERTSQMAYISAFQDYVLDYSSHHNPSVQSLLDNWEDKKRTLSVAAAANIDAVRVMTIHKSKGLEFDCVHIPFASWDEVKLPFEVWIKSPVLAGIDPALCPPAMYVGLEKVCEFEQSIFHESYEKNLRESYVDTLNKTYVAYTRAGRELLVYYEPTKKIGANVKAAMERACTDPRVGDTLINLPDYLNRDTGEFILGSPTTKTPDEAEKPKPTADRPRKIDTYEVYMDAGAQVLARIDDMLDLDRDIDDDARASSSAADRYYDEDSRIRGIILHDILSMINHRDETARAIDAVSRIRRLDDDTRKEMTQILGKMLDRDDPRVERWFGDCEHVLTEQTVYSTALGRERRLDRMVVNHDGSVDIIDYKFTSEYDDGHDEQVLEYIELIKSMGYDRVRGYLWYPLIEGSPIEEVIVNSE